MKTLHPRIHGGLLFRRDDPEHVADAARLGIDPIDLVVVNLYPFEATIARAGRDPRGGIEQIDIGGPSMIRSAAKNHASRHGAHRPGAVRAVPRQAQAGGTWTLEDRAACALAAFQRTARLRRAIAAWMARRPGDGASRPARRLCISLAPAQTLRYGENPHQAGGLLRASPAPDRGRRRLPPAPGQGTELQQPAGRRRRGPPGLPVRRAGLRHRQAQQPLRRGPGPHVPGGLPAGPGRGPGQPPSAASSPSTARWGWKWPGPWSRASGR